MTRAAYSQWACLAISNTMKSTLTSFTSSLLPGRLPGPPKARHSHLAAPDQLCLGPPPLTTITRQQWFPNAPIVHRKNPSPDPSLFEVSFHNKRYNQPNQFGASRRPNKLRKRHFIRSVGSSVSADSSTTDRPVGCDRLQGVA